MSFAAVFVVCLAISDLLSRACDRLFNCIRCNAALQHCNPWHVSSRENFSICGRCHGARIGAESQIQGEFSMGWEGPSVALAQVSLDLCRGGRWKVRRGWLKADPAKNAMRVPRVS